MPLQILSRTENVNLSFSEKQFLFQGVLTYEGAKVSKTVINIYPEKGSVYLGSITEDLSNLSINLTSGVSLEEVTACYASFKLAVETSDNSAI